MLLQLSIQNIALIDQLTVTFGPGLTALTGETGAGKSIVVGSLDFVLGGRADKDRILTGASRGQVEAVFDVTGQTKVMSLLSAQEIEIEDGLLPVTREINLSGRSICRIAGVIVPLAKLKELTSMLVDLHGQHAHQSLLDPRNHLSFLDAMGDSAHRELVLQVQAAFEQWNAVCRELKQTQNGRQERARREDMLKFQLQELDSASLTAGEEKELANQRILMRNAERIREELSRAYAYISEGIDEGIPSAMDALQTAAQALSNIAKYGEGYERLHEQLVEAVYALESIADDLYDLQDQAGGEPERLDEIESRLDLLNRLMRKYGATTQEMIAYREQVREELESSEDTNERLSTLQKQEKALWNEVSQKAEQLSTARHKLAKTLSQRVIEELSELGMQKACFEISFAADCDLSSNGLDQVEFMLSANAGEPLRPLSRVASGGELSRIMLAFKCIEAESEGVPVLVFDEVDTGISGRMGQIVADKMHKVAKSRQMLCVTHLPQIAAAAKEQYLVEKTEKEGKTRTILTLLNQEGRVEAIARMLGEGDTARAHASAMLTRAMV